MPQSPELAGGEGFTFEGDAAAFFLAALLAEAYAPGIENRVVVGVSVQQCDFGEPLDDVIVDFEDASGSPARLSLQVKRSLTISDAATNGDFRKVIADSWRTLAKTDFRDDVDRFGAAVGTISAAKDRDLKTLCDWARESASPAHFQSRFAGAGDPAVDAYRDVAAVRDAIRSLVDEAKGSACVPEELFRFLRHFVLIQFDFLREGATDPSEAINRIRECLRPGDADKAPLVWARLVQLARASAGKSGQFLRPRIVREVGSLARLRGAASLRQDLDRLQELTRSYAGLIHDDVGGARLERGDLMAKLDEGIAAARVVQVRGLPGSGKSVVMKRAVMRAMNEGTVLFLKAEQLEGTSWASFASANGLSPAGLERLLTEVASCGCPVLFIDAIDRVEKEHQPVVVDLIRTIVESPLLDQWRIVVSLRDTGIELLRNWLGPFLDRLTVGALNVNQLSDAEAEALATLKPGLRALLFGSREVQEIVRRPFFANILARQGVAANAVEGFAPASEIELLDNWWKRGGYDECGRNAMGRQRALLELARLRAQRLSQPIPLAELASIDHIEDLRTDGILQTARQGVSVRFAHDIFFEWSFFFVLASRDERWLDEVKACGEPPAVARVVELSAQWEYAHGDRWRADLSVLGSSGGRTQWQRSWLLGPLGTAAFTADDERFAEAAFADDFRLLHRTLVWFQAEKTVPNAVILTRDLPQEQRQRIADLLGTPQDYAACRRLIGFLLRRIAEVPYRLYPDIVTVFEVWQNAFADIANCFSHAILAQCGAWIDAIDASSESRLRPTTEEPNVWNQVPELKSFRQTLAQLILRASLAEPSFAEAFLSRMVQQERIRDEVFADIIAFSPILSQSMPKLLVELSIAALCEELPDDQVAREEKELEESIAWRNAVRAKPEAERTRSEKRALEIPTFVRSAGNFSNHDWDRLSIHDDHKSFSPCSPLREPFHSLFKSAPDEGSRLLRELCNHAITAWRQLHRQTYEHKGTPIALSIAFPWGVQEFWGTNREYFWFRGHWGSNCIGSGLMALEAWCLAEIERGRSPDELIRSVVEGNQCIGVLGVAVMIALRTEHVSDVTLALVTAQRLLIADDFRMKQDFQSMAGLIGFNGQTDKEHVEAVRTANSRPERRKQLAWLVPKLFFDPAYSERLKGAFVAFKDHLPFEYEEERGGAQIEERFRQQAAEFAELVDPENYRAYRTAEDSEQIAIAHVSPSAKTPERVARAESAVQYLTISNLWMWASKGLETGTFGESFTVESGLQLAKKSDMPQLFESGFQDESPEALGMRRGAVSAMAAVVLSQRQGLPPSELEWAREVIGRAIRVQEVRDLFWSPMSIISWHPAIFAARGLAADIKHGTSDAETSHALLAIVAHPLQCVSSAAVAQAYSLMSVDPKLAWAALSLALALCHIPARPRHEARAMNEPFHTPDETAAAVAAAIAVYAAGEDWPPLPSPPPAWIRVADGEVQRTPSHYDEDDANDEAAAWREPESYWDAKRAGDIIETVPFVALLASPGVRNLLEFLEVALTWTNAKNSPPWATSGRRERQATRLYEWTHSLGTSLGTVAGLLPLSEFQPRYLQPMLALEDENCWALLHPFCSSFVCAYIYDAQIVPREAIELLALCLERLLQDRAFNREAYRRGQLNGFDQPRLVQTLMFVSVECANMATRYVNGDWGEINRILPIVDRFVRAAGWAAPVMSSFLTLCERSKGAYPSGLFSEQVLTTIADGASPLTGWRGTTLYARIAGLIEYFAHRDAPMSAELAQRFLRVLDALVDMGDRRSAALQHAEAFREIRLPAPVR
jgi:hypothetical protein